MDAEIMMLKGLILENDAVKEYEHYKQQLRALLESAVETGDKDVAALILALSEMLCELTSKK